jgi:AraC family transcriptional regulator, activator of mtrCDE
VSGVRPKGRRYHAGQGTKGSPRNRQLWTLARQFQEKLGRSASDLLTEIRMTLASNELKKPSVSTGAVADAVGYQSETAFQRAFKSYMGLTPAQWRRGGEFSKADHSSAG